MSSCYSTGTIYYVSSSLGNDNNNGTSGSTPWKTLAKASAAVYRPGDQLLLKCDDTWNETLTLHGNGTMSNPITVSSYGPGARPYIYKSVSNVEDRCIKLDRAMGYRFSGLELGQAWYGIEIDMDKNISTTWDYYYIRDCYFHDIINTDFPHEQHPGIADLADWPWAIYNKLDSASDGCILTNLTVINCFSNRCQGLYNTPWAEGGSGTGSISQRDIVFDKNTFQNCYYNNIYIANSTNFVFTNNVVVFGYPNENIWPYGNAFIISGSPDPGKPMSHTNISGNEFGWAGDKPGGNDGCFYDFEYSQTDTRLENNFFHGAFGEGFLVMGYCDLTNMTFNANVVTDFCQYCTIPGRNCAFEFGAQNGTGTISNNHFFVKYGQTAFNTHPAGFTFINNNEDAGGVFEFVDMPLVTNIATGLGTRAYTFTCATPDSEIRYTMDGSVPSYNSTLYTGSITVGRSCVVNARGFKPGFHPSYTNSVIVDFRDSEGTAPAAWWKLDEASGATASDSSGNNTGMVDGAMWKAGYISNCLYFDGIDDIVSITDSNLSVISDSFTFSFWVNPASVRTATTEDYSGTSGISGQSYALLPDWRGGGPDSNHAGVGVSVGTNGLSVFEHSDDYMPSLLVDDFPISGWTHIAVAYNDKQPYLYVNGKLRKAGYKSTKTVHPYLSLGGSAYGWFKGGLDDIRVYGYPLSHAQIETLCSVKVCST